MSANLNPELPTPEEMWTLARFIRNQVNLDKVPPAGCIQLNNNEASMCGYALMLAANEGLPEMRDHYRNHAMLSKAMPMCFMCGGPSMAWPPLKQHPQLPNVIACERCVEACRP